MLLDHTSGRKMPASVCLGSVPKPPANWLTGSGSALPIPAVRVHLPAPPNPLQSSQNLFIPSQKFRPPFQRWRGRGAVRQRKFGFQPKLPGRKRPSSGDFSDLAVRSAAYAATPPQFALRARGRRPLPAGPTPMGQSALFTCSLSKSFVHLFKGGGVEGQ